jgi:hypothetical protein
MASSSSHSCEHGNDHSDSRKGGVSLDKRELSGSQGLCSELDNKQFIYIFIKIKTQYGEK